MKDLARFGCTLALASKLVPLISLYIHFGKAVMNTVLQHPDYGEGTVVDFLVQKALAQARDAVEGAPRARAPVLRVLEAVLRWKPNLSRRKTDRPKGFAPLSKGPTAPLIKAAQVRE